MSVMWLALHCAVIGYYMGSDLVVNQSTWYFIRSAANPVRERERQLRFLLLCDQHPRMGLVLFIATGYALEAGDGLWPASSPSVPFVLAVCGLWLANIWTSFLLEAQPLGRRLVDIDVAWRLAVALACVTLGVGSLLGYGPMAEPWMAVKYLLLGMLIGGGVSIRFFVRELRTAWPEFIRQGSTPAFEATVHRTLAGASYVNWVLWALFLTMAWLSVARPHWGS
jgi:hypothetical protein